MGQPDEVVIRLREFEPIQLQIRENGIESTKYIGSEALLNCIKDNIKRETVCTGLLPSRTLSVSVSNDGAKYIVVEFPENTADIQYLNTPYPNFPIPRYIFGFRIESSGRVSKVSLGVADLGELKPDTVMYHFPFSNVSRFGMCTGSNVLPHVKNLYCLQNLPYHILSLPDNDDMYHTEHNRLGLGHRELLEHLRDKDTQYYYDHVLIPMENTTLQNFLTGG